MPSSGPRDAPWRSRTSVHGFGDRRAAAVPMARSLFPLFGFQPCHAGRVRGGKARYAFPDGRPTERVPPAEWLRAASLRRPTRLIRAVPPDRATKPTGIPSSHGQVSSRLPPFAVDPPVCDRADGGGGRTRTSGVSLSQSYSLLPSPLGHATGASLLPVTARCVPRPVHLYPQTVGLHKLMGDGSGSWSCRESNPGLACRQPLLAVTCVSDA